MKKLIRNFGLASLAAFVFATGPVAWGQNAIETSATVTSSAGTISEFDPQAIVVRTETSPEPVRYRYSKTTTYVDENGNPVSMETVKSGLPVTVYYDREGNEMMARKVVVRRTVTEPGSPVVVEKKTTTTTSDGTISEFGPQQITVRTESSANPVTYRATTTTSYVDENGNPVSVETVKSGLPVTVYYDREGDGMVARKVIVRRSITNPESGTVIEHKKTTTTTTDER